MNVTREVINDLWPIYAAGEASADTRALIEEFLDRDTQYFRHTRRIRLRGGTDHHHRLPIRPLRVVSQNIQRVIRKAEQCDFLFRRGVLHMHFARSF